MSSTAQPFLWSQRCQNLPKFKIYRSGNCVCFSDAPPNTQVLIVFEDENPGGFVIPVSYSRSSNCFCPSIDLAQFIQHGKWVYFIATDLSDMNTIYACTDYIGNFYASMDLSIKVDTRLDIITQLAPKNVYAVLEITLTAPLQFPKLSFLRLEDMCWADTTWGKFPYECKPGYDVMIFLWIDKYCKNNSLKPPEWTDVWNQWFTYIDADFYYEPYKIVFRKLFDETTLFNTINTGYCCTDDVGRQIPIKLTWLDIDRFIVTIYNEMFIYIITSDGTIVCRNQVNGACFTSTTGQRVDIGNPFQAKADDFNRARQLIALQLQALGTIGSTQSAVSGMASAVSTALLNALNLYPFYTPETPTEGMKPVSEAPITYFVNTVISSIEDAVGKAIRIVIKSIARTYMVLKTYFELGLSVPTSALILFLNNFIKLIADTACRIASKCIGIVSIVLTVPYAIKRLREVAEQEYDIRKPLTSLWRMFTGFGRAARDIFTVWLASVFAGAVICTFAGCPKLQSIQPPFISLPDWYVFEDFCADLCRTPLIEGRIRDYMTCVNRCITSIAPRSPTEKVVVTEAGRTMVYIDESIVSADMGAYTTRAKNVPINAEEIHSVDSLSMAVRNRVQKSVSESISPSDAYRYTTASRVIQSISESTGFYDSITYSTATKMVRELSESITNRDSVNTVIPSVVSKTISELQPSTDKMPEWVLLPPITPYARWIEAVNEYIDPYYGASMTATDVLTGEVIRAGEISRAFHSTDIAMDMPQIIVKPPIYILPSESSKEMFAELLLVGLIKPVTLSTPYVSVLGILIPHIIRTRTAVKLATPATPLIGITVPAVSPYLRMLGTSSLKRLSAYILAVHSTRTKSGAQLTSPTRLSIYASLPQGTRTKSGAQLTSPTRLSIYASLPQGTRTKSGAQLTSPARTCAQITITV
jgi:hypothetical protein